MLALPWLPTLAAFDKGKFLKPFITEMQLSWRAADEAELRFQRRSGVEQARAEAEALSRLSPISKAVEITLRSHASLRPRAL